MSAIRPGHNGALACTFRRRHAAFWKGKQGLETSPDSAGALASGSRIRNGWAMSLLDLGYRILYRYGFQAARLVWRVTRPVHTGALVMLWHDGRVLLVRSSYQRGWMAPAAAWSRASAPSTQPRAS